MLEDKIITTPCKDDVHLYRYNFAGKGEEECVCQIESYWKQQGDQAFLRTYKKIPVMVWANNKPGVADKDTSEAVTTELNLDSESYFNELKKLIFSIPEIEKLAKSTERVDNPSYNGQRSQERGSYNSRSHAISPYYNGPQRLFPNDSNGQVTPPYNDRAPGHLPYNNRVQGQPMYIIRRRNNSNTQAQSSYTNGPQVQPWVNRTTQAQSSNSTQAPSLSHSGSQAQSYNTNSSQMRPYGNGNSSQPQSSNNNNTTQMYYSRPIVQSSYNSGGQSVRPYSRIGQSYNSGYSSYNNRYNAQTDTTRRCGRFTSIMFMRMTQIENGMTMEEQREGEMTEITTKKTSFLHQRKRNQKIAVTPEEITMVTKKINFTEEKKLFTKKINFTEEKKKSFTFPKEEITISKKQI
ncbi:hypothetical protein PROFUN_08211 [Planoprotostelium fungivorum]|uniref:Uncharacterized protein n=1 Tax=Planoprotostelium fungivorum TaxID=1890364 RepID=A0A2P6N676_9EUKA|nr:hypothetical protein PROFUN_08211 [Planoprotostelium fungivorum]